MARGRPKQSETKAKKNGNGANLGFEAQLFLAADKLRKNLEPSDYKHVVLGLIFLKHISQAFEAKREALLAEDAGAAEDPDEYLAENVFWVPKEARWSHLQANAKQPTIGKLIDDAMLAIEAANPSLKGVLPKDYNRPALDKVMLGELIDLISGIAMGEHGRQGERPPRPGLRIFPRRLRRLRRQARRRVLYAALGRARAGRNAGAVPDKKRGMKGGSTTRAAAPAACSCRPRGSSRAHGGRIGDIAIYGQESNYTTWRLCKMNLAVRGIDADIRWNNEGSFHKDELKDLRFDFILANPPFNISDWGGERLREDARWKYGVPPVGNANYAGCSTSSGTWPRTGRPAWCWPTVRCRRRRAARTISAARWSRPTWWTA